MKQKLFHYGCSFTENIHGFGLDCLFEDTYDYNNYGKTSASNEYILNKFKKTAEPESFVILQWSSLTRPTENNFKYVETSDNPLYDLLEEWYLMLEEASSFAKTNNIKLLQYIGWAHWKDNELNDYHRKKLSSFGIKWFTSAEQWDIIASSCFQFEDPVIWSSQPKNGHYLWSHIHWGGMSEWIRTNVDIHDRYLGWVHDTASDVYYYDSHPSKHSTVEFIKQVLLPELNKL